MSVKSVQGRDPMKTAVVHPPKETKVIGVNLEQTPGTSNTRK